VVHESKSESDTRAIAARFAAELKPGAVLLLSGDLGAGKTAFTKGLAQGLGLDPAEVTSPTFTIVQEYRGRLTLQHVDLYRLSPAEVDDLALEDLMEGSVMAVEWPDRWHRAPASAVRVRIEPLDGSRRLGWVEWDISLK